MRSRLSPDRLLWARIVATLAHTLRDTMVANKPTYQNVAPARGITLVFRHAALCDTLYDRAVLDFFVRRGLGQSGASICNGGGGASAMVIRANELVI